MPIFRVKSVKIYTDQKNLHWRRQPRQRQLSGMNPWARKIAVEPVSPAGFVAISQKGWSLHLSSSINYNTIAKTFQPQEALNLETHKAKIDTIHLCLKRSHPMQFMHFCAITLWQVSYFWPCDKIDSPEGLYCELP